MPRPFCLPPPWHCYASFHISICEICIFWQFSKKFNVKTLSTKHGLKQKRVTVSSPAPTLASTPLLPTLFLSLPLPVRIFSKCFYWPLASPGPCRLFQLPHPPRHPHTFAPARDDATARIHDRKLAFVIYHQGEWKARCFELRSCKADFYSVGRQGRAA